MEKLGHAARHRGQHVLAKSTRHRGRKTLVRHDCLPGRTNSTEYLNAASGRRQPPPEPLQKWLRDRRSRRRHYELTVKLVNGTLHG
ncbi:hypothetical protein AK812_SmicGene20580 [Symbiodinium microadriaticum]|uniref:Uncharacterized protein n=1 Tax=Symbiodinium microadriaticum TaxID=2951 RepID=A0A1Q9DPN7_SYMMI|nr:hypothetical protein AK812_SmicGene20580 [Symbiodinium microadriaticum]